MKSSIGSLAAWPDSLASHNPGPRMAPYTPCELGEQGEGEATLKLSNLIFHGGYRDQPVHTKVDEDSLGAT